MGSILPLVLGRLQQGEMVAVGIREVGIDTKRLGRRRGFLELHTAGLEELDVLAAIVRPEHPVVPAAVRTRRRARIDDIPSFQEDELELHAFGRNGEPAGATGLLVVLALLEAKSLRIELQRQVLVANDDRDVGRLLEDAIIGRGRLAGEAGLEHREQVAVRILEGCRDAPRLLLRLLVRADVEVHSACLEPLVTLEAVLREERDVVPRRARFGTYADLDLLFALREDKLEFLSLGRDGEPAWVTGQAVIRALLEAERFRVKLQGFLLIAHDDGHMRQFFDHGVHLPNLYDATVI